MRKYRLAKHKKITNEQFFSSVELAMQLQNFVRKFVVYPEVIINLADEKILETTKKKLDQELLTFLTLWLKKLKKQLLWLNVSSLQFHSTPNFTKSFRNYR